MAADGTRDTDADVITSGREPRRRPGRPGRLVWLLVVAETVVLAVSVGFALHERTESAGLPRGRPPAASAVSSPMPELTGYSWTGAVTDYYWLALDPSPVGRPPGLHGQFAEGRAAPFPAGQPPCPPSP